MVKIIQKDMAKCPVEERRLLDNGKQIFKMIRMTLFLLFSCMLYAQAGNNFPSEAKLSHQMETTPAVENSIKGGDNFSQQVNQRPGRVHIT
jgi:hypothetical protein